MAIEHLSEEQVSTWSRAEKDRWWLERVYRGDMPQLTWRSAVTGFALGGILSLTNLYVGAKTGWTLGVGITSVILAFATFRLLARAGAKDLTILENNAVQSIATAAGYMTSPLTSGIAAFMMISNTLLPWQEMLLFNVVLSVLGVLVAFPMKRRFINDEQQPFPEGRACGVVLDTLYTSEAAVGFFKAKVLMLAAGGAALLKLISGPALMKYLQTKLLGLKDFWHLHENFDHYYYRLAEKHPWLVPRLAGVDIRQLGLSPTVDMAMVGAGGLMGMRPAASLLLGMVVNFVLIVPIMIARGEIPARPDGTYTRAWILNHWALWWGITIMVVASLTSLFAKPQVIISAFSGFFKKREQGADVLRHIELPLWVSFLGVPVLGAIGVWMIHVWFGVRWDLGALAVPLVILLTLIAANATALTSITPSGSLSKIPQFLFGSIDPMRPATNLMTALMCVEVGSNASNLLMDIKPGYMLGAKPRQQAVGHCIGILAGALVSTPMFYLLFLSKVGPGSNIEQLLTGGQFGFPSAIQWKGVSDLVQAVFAHGGTPIPDSAVWSMIIAAGVGLVFEIARVASKGKFPLSPLAIGLGVVIPPDSTMAMFAGALFFWLMHRRYAKDTSSFGHKVWVDTHEPICAGLIAGAALLGILDKVVEVFLL